MRNDGHIYAGNLVDAQNVQGRDHVWAGGDRKAWMRNDGYIYAGNWLDAQNVQGRDHVRAGGDGKAWMRNDGYIYAGNWLDAQNVQGRDHVRAGGNWQAWMRNDGNGQFTDTLSVGGVHHPDSMRGWGWKFGVQQGNNQTWIGHRDGHGIMVNTANNIPDRQGLQIENGERKNFQVRNNGEVWVNDKPIFFRNPDNHDKNHGIGFIDGRIDGPTVYGFAGGSLSVPSQSFMNNPNQQLDGNSMIHVAQWNRNQEFIVNRNFVNRSDSRAKNNIKPLTLEDYQKLNDIQPVSFTWKHNPGGEKQSGFIAQNVEKVYPHLVTENKEYKNLNYLGLMPMIVGNLQQVNQYINPKEKQICIEDVCLTKDDLAAVKKGTSLMKNT
jgi:hypothetical protein